ncbi:MAG: YkgJ family cysteine cluster protein [Pirellulaceae bacterium]
MSDAEFLCVRCARHITTCCQHKDVYVTLGDVQRIQHYGARKEFHEFRAPENPDYLDQDNDPLWRDHTCREDGMRRVLLRAPNGDCTFLGPHGCQLPLDVRPLVCRLYPYDYTADGILEQPAPGCPLDLLPPGIPLMQALHMPLAEAQKWHQQLYREIQCEEAAQT